MSDARSPRRLLAAVLFILAGLAVEALSLRWNSPRGFLLFVIGGGLLTLAGVALYLRESFFRGDAASR